MESTDVRRIFVDHGFVMKVQELSRRNGALWPVVTVERIQKIEKAAGLFKGGVGDPRDGIWMLVDKAMDKVLRGLTPARQEEYRKLFSLCDPTSESLKQIGFGDFVIIEEAA